MSWLRETILPAPSRGVAAYNRAMAESGALIQKMQNASSSSDPLRAIFADMWLERNNVPYATSMYETHQEMITPLRQDGET